MSSMPAVLLPSVLAVFAHPDDETLAAGALLARLAASGASTHLITATSGEGGWKGSPRPEPHEIGLIRDFELRQAARVLGVRSVRMLGLPDGHVGDASTAELVQRIAIRIREVRPSSIITFGQDGLTGHPDHIAVSQAVAAAVVEAATSRSAPNAPHRVANVWHVGHDSEQRRAYEALIGPAAYARSEPERRPPPWAAWMASVTIDASSYVPVVRSAVQCHRSQLGDGHPLSDEPMSMWNAAFARTTLYLAMSVGNATDPVRRLVESTATHRIPSGVPELEASA